MNEVAIEHTGSLVISAWPTGQAPTLTGQPDSRSGSAAGSMLER